MKASKVTKPTAVPDNVHTNRNEIENMNNHLASDKERAIMGTKVKAQSVIDELNVYNRILSKSKLNGNDIRLILYLIVQIKPFKYVGDRSVSQTYKWELVQRKYVEIKEKELYSPTKVVAPTVRTLQRQLASAIKRASSRASSNQDTTLNIGEILERISRDSSVEELEDATYQLNTFSENLKAGREVPVDSVFTSHEFDSLSELILSLPRIPLMSSQTTSTSQEEITSYQESVRQLEATRSQVKAALVSEDIQSLKTLVQTIQEQSKECEKVSLIEYERQLKQTRALVEQKMEECAKTIESVSRDYMEQQRENKALIEKVLHLIS